MRIDCGQKMIAKVWNLFVTSRFCGYILWINMSESFHDKLFWHSLFLSGTPASKTFLRWLNLILGDFSPSHKKVNFYPMLLQGYWEWAIPNFIHPFTNGKSSSLSFFCMRVLAPKACGVWDFWCAQEILFFLYNR